MSHKPRSAENCLQMPFIHWETCSRQLDTEFSLLLRFLLKLLDAYDKERTTDLAKLTTEDMKFLWYYLGRSHSRATTPQSEKRIKNPRSSFDGSTTGVSKTAKPWTLSLSDIGMFRIRPTDNQSKHKVDGSEKVIQHDPAQVRKVQESLQLCYNSTLAGDREHMLANVYAENDHPLHLRRTLDQSYYYMLNDTRSRDLDQVVSRYGKTRGHREPLILMVDQLVWPVLQKNPASLMPSLYIFYFVSKINNISWEGNPFLLLQNFLMLANLQIISGSGCYKVKPSLKEQEDDC